MMRGVGETLARPLGQHVDRAWSLTEQIEELQPGRARERLADPGELLVMTLLKRREDVFGIRSNNHKTI